MSKIRNNKVLVAAIIIILLFGAWNLTWYIQTQNRYAPFLEAIPENQSGTHSIRKADDYVYNVKAPDYLSYTGNLGVSNLDKGEALIIWPLMSGDYTYGFRLTSKGQTYEIYVDKNMEPVDKNNEETNQLVQQFKPQLDALYEKALNTWDLE